MSRRLRVCGACVYMAVVSLILLGLGLFAVEETNTPAATILFTLGGGALVAVPFLSRLEGTLRIGPLELTLRRQVINAAETASEDSLEGVLPLLASDDFRIAKIRLPDRFSGRRLVDPELAFLRKKLKLSVVGERSPGDNRWLAGGSISERELTPEIELLVAGHPDTLSYLHALIAADDDELWERVR